VLNCAVTVQYIQFSIRVSCTTCGRQGSRTFTRGRSCRCILDEERTELHPAILPAGDRRSWGADRRED